MALTTGRGNGASKISVARQPSRGSERLVNPVVDLSLVIPRVTTESSSSFPIAASRPYETNGITGQPYPKKDKQTFSDTAGDVEADFVLVHFVARTSYRVGIYERLIRVEADAFGDDKLVSLVEPECFSDHRLVLPIG